MSDDSPVDPWAASVAAFDERDAGLAPRAMLSRAEAMAKANAFLRQEGRSDVAVSATPNPVQGLWIVGHHDPQRPDEVMIGDGPLIVPTDEPAYWSGGSVPPWPEEQGMDEPEAWVFDRGGDLLPDDWSSQLAGEFAKDYWFELLEFVAEERGAHDVLPSPSQTFEAFHRTPFVDVRVVILGQDPYPTPGDAHGLAFSVPVGVPVPQSLRNIHAELESDCDLDPPKHGNLEGWAEQGVLLLNTALTVRCGSEDDRKVHRKWRWQKQGWNTFTEAVIGAVNAKPDPVVFILWGADARKKKSLIADRHAVIESFHPSPFSVHGFRGTKPFSRTNEFLKAKGRGEIDWSKFGSRQ